MTEGLDGGIGVDQAASWHGRTPADGFVPAVAGTDAHRWHVNRLAGPSKTSRSSSQLLCGLMGSNDDNDNFPAAMAAETNGVSVMRLARCWNAHYSAEELIHLFSVEAVVGICWRLGDFAKPEFTALPGSFQALARLRTHSSPGPFCLRGQIDHPHQVVPAHPQLLPHPVSGQPSVTQFPSGTHRLDPAKTSTTRRCIR